MKKWKIKTGKWKAKVQKPFGCLTCQVFFLTKAKKA
ncbi:hypothetical protein ELI_2884 [Eubacterium callanderi]|uniref:Uncharacterized protein n=1 Tax=Eubacterium callanderi TaxID=53442 RepID=E3GP79_9FIRM|nr:hypothetical protein ELI_2884 [Eubacterium callanderi]